ncbi:MAG TPA: hypothetical protein VGC45_11275 [Gryllotalpicola sp.]
MLADAGLTITVTPHSFRRAGDTVVARVTDAKTPADTLGNTEAVAKRHYVELEKLDVNPMSALHLKQLALTACRA